MAIAYFIALILISELLHMVAVDQQSGYNPYPFGTTILCMITHLFLLVSCIWYCGWLFGVVLFLCELFSILHGTIGWVLNIPLLFIEDEEKIIRGFRRKINLLSPTLLFCFIGCVLSFVFVPYKSLYLYVQNNINHLIIFAILAVVGFIARFIVSKKYM